jgi:hypothetical protein
MKYPVIAIIADLTKANETDTGRGLVLLNHTILAEKKTDGTVDMPANFNAMEEVSDIVIELVERSQDEYQPLEEGRKQSSDNEGSESSADSKQNPVKGNVRRGSRKGGKKN